MQLVWGMIFTVLSAAAAVVMSGKMFQIYQLSSYKAKGFFDWLKATRFDYLIRYFAAAFFSVVCMFIFVSCFKRFGDFRLIGFSFLLFFAALFTFVTARERKKTPLKITPRIIRLYVAVSVLNLGLCFLTLWLGSITPLGYSLLGAVMLLIPFTVTAANCAMLPLEACIRQGFVKKAQKKFAAVPGLIRVGITGSYGKTTAKNVLAGMLSEKYRVLATPQSFNTPMGICKTVNSGLSSETEVFIAEMGARRPGDIRELARLVRPNIALITAIGEQHLETFGSRENIFKTKYELIEELEKGGQVFFNADSDGAAQMYKTAKDKERYLAGKEGDGLSASYEDVTFGPEGTKFKLKLFGEEAEIVTSLLGEHIPSVIAVCAAAAYKMGVPLNSIVNACATLEQVPHRLELIEEHGMIILDDAYNSNPAGAESALKVLSSFTDKYKIIVTPGMVELGEEEAELNRNLGERIAATCDYAIFLGARSKELSAGAKAGGLNEENIAVAETLSGAVEIISRLPGNKAVLFENDLPDNIK